MSNYGEPVRVTQSISAIACLALAACGGATTRDRVTVEAVALHTRAARTARMDGSLKATDPTSITRVTGEADFNGSRYHFKFASPSSTRPFDEFIAIGTQAFVLGGTLGAVGWCAIGTVSSDLNFDPGAVLGSINKANGTLQRLGEESVRGIATNHYRYVRPDNPPMELWVDSNDLLRRIVETHENETDTLEFYDFGADITPITAPTTSPKCPPSSSSESGSITAVAPTTTP